MRLLKGILARVSMVLFGFVLVEVGLRIAGVSYPIFDAYDADRVFKLMPGKQGRYEKECSAFLSINSLGYRDEEHAREKPAGVFRIAVLGDSFTEARQVEIEDTYWKRLETLLNADSRIGPERVEVLNFGIGGYGQTEELMTLRLDALSFDPDLVVIGFFGGNDLVNNLRSLSISVRGESIRPFYVLQGDELVLDESYRAPTVSLYVRRFLLSATHYLRTLEVVNQIRRQLAVRRMQENQTGSVEEQAQTAAAPDTGPQEIVPELGIRNSQYVSPPEGEWAEAWQITEALLREIQHESNTAGAKLVVTTISDSPQVHPDAGVRARYAQKLGASDLLYPDRRLAEIAARDGFTLVPMVERMAVQAEQENLWLHGFENTAWGRGHWNAQAHALAAEILAADLIAAGLVPLKE